MHDLSAFCDRWARHQGGLVLRAQLLDGGGLTAGQVNGLVHRRRLVPVASSLYRLAGDVVPPEQAAWAAVLATGGRLIGEHLFALHSIEGGSFAGPPTVLLPPGIRPPSGIEVRIIGGACDQAERRTVAGLPAVAVARAVVELASDHSLRDVRRVVDSGRWLGQLTVQSLLRCADARPPEHLGGHKVRWMHEAGLFADESEGERTLDQALGTLGLLFRHQVDDVVPGRRFDRYCDLARLALEYDGREGERDADRDAAKDLVAAGHHVLVLHITKKMVRPGALRQTVASVAAQVVERGTTRPWPT